MLFTLRKLSMGLTLAIGTAVLAAVAVAAPLPPRGAALDSAERANPRAVRSSDMARVPRQKWRASAQCGRGQRCCDGTRFRIAPAPGSASLRDPQDDDACTNDPNCGRGYREDGPRGGQAEITIAIDSTGQHVVVGFNDQRGFALNPLSVSGFMYSDDGGNTFVDGGQLPSPGDTNLGGTLLPRSSGSRAMAGAFLFSSIIIAANADTVAAQTMGVHRSTDCGHTWTGPYEVVAATNPVFLNDAADKEFMDVDPDTGRLMMTWTNFQADGNVRHAVCIL